MEKLLKVVDVSKKYEGQPGQALSHISFEVNRGNILAIAGESGSGKTTLLKLIAGIEDVDSGKILLEEKAVTGPAYNLVPGHKQIKLVFQDFRLFPNITVYQNIEYFLRSYPSAFQKERIEYLLHVCKLSHLQHRYPRQLSGGEQQRVALARALADDPLLLLLDEPFSNMDELLKGQLKDDLTDIIRNSHSTAIVVTHDAKDALSLADTIVVMKQGKIMQAGTPQNIYQKPVSAYVARFFGTCTIVDLQALMPYLPAGLQANKPMPPAKNTWVCIRAEHIRIGTSEDAPIKARVAKISYFGAYYQVEAVADNKFLLILHTVNASLQIGETLSLFIDIAGIHYFHA